MSEITKRKKGQMLNNTERQLILNLITYLRSKNSEKSISEIIREISKATGCSERTIYKIKKEGITVTPNKTRSRKKENKNSRNVKYDSFVKSLIRKKIRNYFLQKDSPTLNTILCLVNNDPDLPNFKRSTLHTLLKEIGFVYEQKGKKSLLTERRDLVELRQVYLKDIKKFREENRGIVYLGQTVISLAKGEINKQSPEEEKCANFPVECETMNTVFINASDLMNGTTFIYTIDASALENVITTQVIEKVSSKGDAITINNENTSSCVEKTIKEKKPTKKANRELRLMIMHAGSDEGFIQGADFIRLSKKKAEDLENYKYWFLEKLLPKIPPNSVIVTDHNPPFDKVEENIPNSSWKKQQIKNWLNSKNIKVDNLSQKKELLEVVNQVKPIYSTNYKINECAREKGIIIVNLPPFHYELNPLNMVWAQIKYYVSSNIKCFKIKKIKQLIREGFYSISQLSWINLVHHVREAEELLWSVDEHQQNISDKEIHAFNNLS